MPFPRRLFDMVTEGAIADLDTLVAVMGEVQKIHVSEVFVKHCVETVRRTREHEKIELGASPRAGIALVQAARARCLHSWSTIRDSRGPLMLWLKM